jgi:hypothetical protein
METLKTRVAIHPLPEGRGLLASEDKMTEEVNSQQAPEPVKTDKEINFERVRKQLEQERAEKLQYQQKLKALEEERQKSVRLPYKDDDEDYDENEPYVDHKSLKKKFAQFEQGFEKKVDQLAEQKARTLLEQDKQNSYIKQNPDFNQLLTPENIEKFANEHPAIAERMLRMPDTFDRQALLYEQMKAFQKEKSDKPHIQETIDQNRRSPYYRPTGTPSAPYNGMGDFSPTGQKAAYQKMQELKSKLRL